MKIWILILSAVVGPISSLSTMAEAQSDQLCDKTSFGYFEVKGASTYPPKQRKTTLISLSTPREIIVKIIKSSDDRDPKNNNKIEFLNAGTNQAYDAESNRSYVGVASKLILTVRVNDPGMRTFVRGCWKFLE